MKHEQLAAQLYTVRAHTQIPKEFAAALKKVREIGFTAVEISGHGPVEDEELARMLEDEGLTCCSSHESGEELFSDVSAIVKRMKTIKCDTATFPWPGEMRFDTLDGVMTFAERLEAAGKALAEAGITFAYHNHHMEFHRVGGKTALQIIYNETSPKYVKAELDTYWIQFGGGSPADWCTRMKGRLHLLHMKDYAITANSQVTFAEVGSGNLNWFSIVGAAEESGCKWFVPEQDECNGSPFDSLKKSYDFVVENFCG